ncbi:MAG: SGNH hydrolase domain-containing protein [Rhodocyclaceae bacterium]|nr:SGNH hydrolase domain-containing protein [Rhodocyclaceae bacterium]
MAVEVLYSRELYKTLYREGTCLLELSISHEGFSPGCTGERPRMVLWGDSHAAHLWPGLSKAVAPGSVAQWTASGCPPLMHVDIPKARHCREINEWVLKAVKEMRPEVVILAGAWFRPDDATIRQGLAETLSALSADPGWQPQVVVVGSVPIWHKTLPRILASDLLGGDESAYSRNGLDQEAFRKDRLIRTPGWNAGHVFLPDRRSLRRFRLPALFFQRQRHHPFGL